MRSRSKFVVFNVAAVIVAGITGTLRAQMYDVTLIPPVMDPGGAASIGVVYAQGISPTGEITGYFVEDPASPVGTWGNVPLAFTAQVTGSTVTEQYQGYDGGTYLPSDTWNYPGLESYDFGVNSAGTTVGGGSPSDYSGFFALTENAGSPMQSLGILPLNSGTSVAPSFPAFASAISSNGVIAGASIASGLPNKLSRFVHAVVQIPGQGLTDLSAGTTDMSVAYAVNPAGNAVVGFDSLHTGGGDGKATTGKVATMWSLSGSTWTQTSLGTLGGTQSVAYGINAAGQVVGVSQNSNGAVDPFLRQPNGTMVDLMGTPSTGSADLGNPIPGDGLDNVAIAPTGVGSGNGNVLNSGLGVTSCADAINDLGQVVGYSGGHAFIATVNSSNVPTLIDLNTLISPAMQSVWILKEATAINDQGQIVGWGLTRNGEASFELSLAPIGTWNSSSGGSWTASGNWQGGIPNASGVVATFGATPGLTSDGIVTLDANQTVGHLVFNNTGSSYTLNAGTGGTLTIDDTTDLAGASPSIAVSAGSHTINAPIVLATNNGSMGVTINTWAGTTLTLGGTITAYNNGAATLTTAGAGMLVINPGCSIYVPVVANGPITFAANTNTSSGFTVHTVSSITLGATATVTVAPALTQASRQLLVTTPIFQPVQVQNSDYSGYVTAWAGQIDLANNDMDIPNGNLANLTAQVAEGYNIGYQGGTWTGTNFDQGYTQGATIIYNGIISSSAANDTTHLTALGVIQNKTASGTALYSTFDGHTVTSTDVLIKYTYYGDANLDGKVDGSDYSLVDNAYLNERSTGLPSSGWYNGDFNFDGVVDGSDYTLLDNAFNSQGASLAGQVLPLAAVTAQIAPVPEPTTLGLMGLTSACLLGRRRARRNRGC